MTKFSSTVKNSYQLTLICAALGIVTTFIISQLTLFDYRILILNLFMFCLFGFLLKAYILKQTWNTENIIIAGIDHLIHKKTDMIDDKSNSKLIESINSFCHAVKTKENALKENLFNAKMVLEEFLSASSVISASSGELSKGTGNISKMIKEITSYITSMSSDAEGISSTTSGIASAFQELSSSINEISQNCIKGSEIAADATHKSNTTNQNVKQLELATQNIGKIIKTISNIASQTNLLALNATIEAASAGKAGRGFAVVANEVKELAKQTATATSEIAMQVEEIQKISDISVKSIDEITSVINESNSISQTIAAAVEEQSAIIKEISNRMAESNQNVIQISDSVKQTSQSLAQISDDVDEIAGNSNTVSKKIEDLNDSTSLITELIEDAIKGL